jgi:NifU-like protein involved in Fe-S cluster formation
MNGDGTLYQDAIKQFAAAAHGHGRLVAASGAARLDNPLCGDRIHIEVAIASGHISAVAHETRGCLLCRAAASLIAVRAVGQDEDGIEVVTGALEGMLKSGSAPPAAWKELAMFEPAHAHASRHGCILLPFRALLAALRSAAPPGAEDRTTKS